MNNEQLTQLINELFDVAEHDEVDQCIVLQSRRVGIFRFEQFVQRVRDEALTEAISICEHVALKKSMCEAAQTAEECADLIWRLDSRARSTVAK